MDVRKAIRNKQRADLEEDRQIHTVYLEEVISRQYSVEVKTPCYGFRPPDSNPWSSNLPTLRP